MARSAIVFGLLLCGLSLFGMVAASAKSPFQFVPLMFGIPVLFCGVVGLNPHRRRLCRPIAAVIMALGVLVGLMEMMQQVWGWSENLPLRPVLFAMSVVMTLVCIVFVLVFIVRWRIDSRRLSIRKTPNQTPAMVVRASSQERFSPAQLPAVPNEASRSMAEGD